MTATRRYNKRQLKKKYLGEFKELCFLFDAKLTNPLGTDWETFVDRFLAEVIEANGLAFGGGGDGKEFSGFVGAYKRYGKVEDSHRTLVREWLEKQSQLTDVNVGELRDAWHGWD
ncbi:DUF469 family protein [Pseudoduganella eburnea]|uniref:DUF469 family protein n=1 Tax=Massilia eburnea TaxID=1776165 RepID=A0A6L6QB56_9BURK|nr:50S ribosome-binding protein YggL [Massilia eburnea]MTW09294.1 DUF469 family protein [Massilia eburnea]